MPYVGDTPLARLQVNPYAGPDDDDPTLATLRVTSPPAATVATPTATSTDDGHTWLAQLTYAAAGVYDLLWTVTGTGAGKVLQRVQVAPVGGMVWRTYATSTDLANWLGAAPPSNADRVLARATIVVDRLLKTARYAVDDDGMPTDADVAAALRDMTCEQVSWWSITGDEHGASGLYQNAKIGSISLGRGGGSGSSAKAATVPRHSQLVLDIADNAGLLGHGPIEPGAHSWGTSRRFY